MESPPAFCTVTETIANLANAKIAQGQIPAPYHHHKAVANTMPEPPIMTECLQDSSDQHWYWVCLQGIQHVTTYNKYYKSPGLSKPKHWNGMEDASKTTAATLQQLAKEVVLHPTTTSSATCPARAQLSPPTIQHQVLQATRASPDNTGCLPLEYADVFMDNFILLIQGPIE
jgi:hypothetical protein